MSILDDTNCQLCERFITKEQWNKHLPFSRHLHREAHGYGPVIFPQSKLARDEKIIFEKGFWKVFFATKDIKEVEQFWLTYFIMKTNIKDYMSEDKEENRKVIKSTMEGQFEHDLKNKSFNNQLESDKTDTLQPRIKWWIMVVEKVGPIHNDVYDYSVDELFGLYRKAIEPEMQDLAHFFRDRQIIP